MRGSDQFIIHFSIAWYMFKWLTSSAKRWGV